MTEYGEVFSSFELRNETNLKLASLKRFENDGEIGFHANFLFQYWDEGLEMYDNIELSIQVRGENLDALTINDIKKIALKRAEIATQSLSEHIIKHAG